MEWLELSKMNVTSTLGKGIGNSHTQIDYVTYYHIEVYDPGWISQL